MLFQVTFFLSHGQCVFLFSPYKLFSLEEFSVTVLQDTITGVIIAVPFQQVQRHYSASFAEDVANQALLNFCCDLT